MDESISKKRKFETNLVGLHPLNRVQTKFKRFTISSVSREKEMITLETHQGVTVILIDFWKDSFIQVGDVVNVISRSPILSTITISREENILVVHPDLLLNCSKMSESYECMRRGYFDRFQPFDSTISALHGVILHSLYQLHYEAPITDFEKELREIMKDHIMTIHDCDTNEDEIIKVFQDDFKQIFEKTVVTDKVLDIEESIWSPLYGLKAKVDISLLSNQKVVPFELKTGKLNQNFDRNGKEQHRAQVLFYIILMSERYEQEIQDGILYYVKYDSTFDVKRNFGEIASLLFGRNQVASNIVRGFIGNTMKQCNSCNFCFSKSVCMSYHKIVENGTEETSGVPILFQNETDHLTEADCAFFAFWFKELDSDAPSDYFWHFPGHEREARFGTCLSCCVISSQRKGIAILKRSPGSKHTAMSNTVIQPGDTVLVGTENGHFGVAFAYVVTLTENEVVLSVDHVLQVPERKDVLWRVDKREGTNDTMRTFVYSLSIPKNDLYRQWIIYGKKPTWTESKDDKGNTCLPPSHAKILNRCLATRDYLLVNGAAGSGKTVLISHLIHELYTNGKRVLYSCHSNAHLDQMQTLLTLLEVPFYKVGKKPPFSSTNEVKAFLQKQMIFLTPLNTTRSVFLNKIPFDVCIVDESTQIPFPMALGVMMHAKSLLLFGDVRLQGPKDTLWSVLGKFHPEFIMELDTQYRNSPCIQDVINLYFGTKGTSSSTQVPTQIVFDTEWMNKISTSDISFCLTDSLENKEESLYKDYVNRCEIRVAKKIIDCLLEASITAGQIGFLTLYGAQLKLMDECRITKDIVSKCWGMEKDVIIVSLVHTSLDPSFDGGVANIIHSCLTRARQKIIFIGSGAYHAKWMPKWMRIFKTKNYLVSLTEKDMKSSPKWKSGLSPIIKSIESIFLE